jgi:hypothetical protein
MSWDTLRARSSTPAATAGVLVLLLLWTFRSVLGDGELCLAEPLSELPVKLWVYDTFGQPGRFFGGVVESIGWPNPGPLNNPDLLGTLVVSGLRPLLGDCGAWNLLVGLTALANGLAAAALARQWTGSERSAQVAALAVALMPLVWVHCVAGAVLDLMNVWPFLLSLHQLRVAYETRSIGRAAAAGLWFSLGAVLCPYNALIFAPAVVPLGVLIGWNGPQHVGLAAPPRLAEGLGLLFAAGLGLITLAMPFFSFTQQIMADANSQIASGLVGSTRHAWPFTALHPWSEQYVAVLSDYVAVGPGGVTVRDNVSRFYRALSPGWTVLALSVLGALLPSKRQGAGRLWTLTGLFFVLLSLGPFFGITQRFAATTPVNPLWLAVFYGFPGQALLLEPFRFGLVAACCFAVAAAIGAAVVVERGQRWRRGGAVLVAVVGLDLLLVAPRHASAPTTSSVLHPVYAELNDILPPGPILDLPFFVEGSRLFTRRPFLAVTRTGRPIPNGVAGFVPDLLRDNAFARSLLLHERHDGPHRLPDASPRERMPALRALVEAGLVGVVVHPQLYRGTRAVDGVRTELRALGEPVEVRGDWVWRLPTLAELDAEGAAPVEPSAPEPG